METFSVVDITPDIAAKMLRTNTKNRPVSRATVDRYAEIMKRGEWVLNGDTITFDENNVQVDGQHRCLAVIKSGVTIPCIVVRGVSVDAFLTKDGGKRRSNADVLGINGVKHTRATAAAIRAYVRLKKGNNAANFITPTQCVEILESHPFITYWTGRYIGARKTKELMPASISGALALASEKYGMEICERFFDQLNSGAGLAANDPAYVLRERFLAQHRGSKLPAETELAFIVKALGAHCKGQKIKLLRMIAGESFPEL
jgi:hypothetical protein